MRGLTPFPGAFFEADWGQGMTRVKVLRSARAEGSGKPGAILDEHGTIACGTGAIRLVEVQRAGKEAVTAAEFLRGAGWRIGQMLV